MRARPAPDMAPKAATQDDPDELGALYRELREVAPANADALLALVRALRISHRKD